MCMGSAPSAPPPPPPPPEPMKRANRAQKTARDTNRGKAAGLLQTRITGGSGVLGPANIGGVTLLGA